MPDINKMAPRSGRVMKEDGTVINIADAGLPVQLTGSNVGLTIADAPTSAKDGDSFYAIDENDGEGQAYLYFSGQWRAI